MDDANGGCWQKIRRLAIPFRKDQSRQESYQTSLFLTHGGEEQRFSS